MATEELLRPSQIADACELVALPSRLRANDNARLARQFEEELPCPAFC
jgi:hypothetical protein